MKSGKDRRKLIFRLFLVAMLLVCAVFFLEARKDMLVGRLTRLLESTLSRGMDVEVKIGKISGHVLGYVNFKDVQVSEPGLPAEQATIFKAKEIQFRYRFLDFLSKKYDSKVEVIVKKPEVYWHPRVSIAKPNFPFLGWMREWALSQKKHLVVRIEDMSLTLGSQEKQLRGVDVTYEDNSFSFEIPIAHVNIAESDVSTVLYAKGRFETGWDEELDSLTGQIETQGTVINWRPLPKESKFDFVFSNDHLSIHSSDLLGGIELTGEINFTKDYEADFKIKAANLPLSNFAPFMGLDPKFSPEGHMDLDVHFYGSPWAPNVVARARLDKGWLNRKDFKAMEVNVAGVYPTVKIENSRILLEDGSVMHFADKTLEAKELFKSSTYETLAREAQQDNVVWGDWEFSRTKGVKDQGDFSMERSLGGNTSVHLRKLNEERQIMEPTDNRDMEVGLEYKLQSKDSLKVELRGDEEMVGVERKLRF